MRLAVLSSHPIQYYAPLYRVLARQMDIHVFFAHRATPADQARAGFAHEFDWDVDLTSGYEHSFLVNVSAAPGVHHFYGCDTPEIGQRLRQGRFDALLLQGWGLKTYVQGLFAAKRLRLPALVRGDSHLETPRSGLKRWAKALCYPPLLRLFDAALYVGTRSRAYYTRYGYPPAQLFFSPHCVDNDWFAASATETQRRELRRKFDIADETRVLLFAGKLVPFKRPLDLIDAAARARSHGPNVEVMIAGEGELREQIEEAARRQGVPLHLLGFCNQSKMPAVYAATDCLVLPSDGNETWGLVCNEALACGRPIIVSDACGCAPDLTADEGAGRIFPAGDIAALTSRIIGFEASPPSGASIAAVSGTFSVAAAAEGVRTALSFVSASKSLN